jgi:hypothetical protein
VKSCHELPTRFLGLNESVGADGLHRRSRKRTRHPATLTISLTIWSTRSDADLNDDISRTVNYSVICAEMKRFVHNRTSSADGIPAARCPSPTVAPPAEAPRIVDDKLRHCRKHDDHQHAQNGARQRPHGHSRIPVQITKTVLAPVVLSPGVILVFIFLFRDFGDEVLFTGRKMS